MNQAKPSSLIFLITILLVILIRPNVSIALDTDNDGISDSIELRYGYNSTSAEETPKLLLNFHSDIKDAIDSYHTSRNFDFVDDINADGYPDFVIGDYSDDDNVLSEVKVYSGKDNSLAFTFKAEITGTRHGCNVADAGDMNNDTYSDIAITECLGANRAGKVIIYSGKDGTLLNTFEGKNERDYFGHSIESIGDINSDGFDDLIIGAPYTDYKFNGAGSVYLISGKNSEVIYQLDGKSNNALFGESISNINDINKDGINDFVIGSPGDSGLGFYYGSAQVHSGRDGSLLFQLNGISGKIQANFGTATSAAGDINNDATPDILIGSNRGNTYVFSGKDGSILRTYKKKDPYSDIARGIADVGDINNDEYNDIAISDEYNSIQILSGKTDKVLFTLRNDPRGLNLRNIATHQDSHGNSVLAVASSSNIDNRDVTINFYKTTVDLDNDNIPDDIDIDDDGDQLVDTFEDELGSNDKATDTDLDGLNDSAEVNSFNLSPLLPDSDNNGTIDLDEVTIINNIDTDKDSAPDSFESYHGYDLEDPIDAPSITFLPEYLLTGPKLSKNFANTVSGATDINKDGFIDILINHPNTILPSYRINTKQDGLGFGSLALIGNSPTLIHDINLDGHSDIVTMTMRGSKNTLIFYSGKDNSIIKTIIDDDLGYYFNRAPSSAGDLNKDGIGDIIVSARDKNVSSNQNFAIVISGKDFEILHRFNIGELVYTTQSAGDINNDSYPDIMIAGIKSKFSIVKIFSGKEGNLLYSYGGKESYEQPNSVITSGYDINKDGYDDFALSYKNKTKVISGFNGLVLFELPNKSHGRVNIKFINDVNRDEFPDIAVSEYAAHNDLNGQGIMAIYSGQNGELLHQILGSKNSLQLGLSIDSLGDVNRDGYGDFIASSIMEREHGENYGQAIVYISSVDLDKDGISDHHDLDDDGDDLSDADEIALGTNRREKDSDRDRLEDGYEVHTSNTNPLNIDTDSDRLNDHQEVNLYNTSPLIKDTDEDGLDDGDEVKSYFTNPLAMDSDKDTITDGDEVYLLGTNPRSRDTDSDGLDDNIEVSIHNTSPTNSDTDSDYLMDYDEIFYYSTSPINSDTDKDLISDGEEVLIQATDPLNPDSDHDGLSDFEEINNHKTNPNNIDSDSDGKNDFEEIRDGSNPNSHLVSKTDAGHINTIFLIALIITLYFRRQKPY